MVAANPGQQKLEKAYISVMPGSGGGPSSTIHFKFNPNDYHITKSSEWRSVPQRGLREGGIPQFTGTRGRTLEMEIFFDATDTDNGSVMSEVEALFACCEPTKDSVQRNQPCPPKVLFGWGSMTSFTSYIESVSAKFTLFRQSGDPVRATCFVRLVEIPDPPGRQNPSSGTLEVHRSHTTVVGDSLAGIAHHEYGDPTLWRVIAEANAIDDPMRVRAGTALLIPIADASSLEP